MLLLKCIHLCVACNPFFNSVITFNLFDEFWFNYLNFSQDQQILFLVFFWRLSNRRLAHWGSGMWRENDVNSGMNIVFGGFHGCFYPNSFDKWFLSSISRALLGIFCQTFEIGKSSSSNPYLPRLSLFTKTLNEIASHSSSNWNVNDNRMYRINKRWVAIISIGQYW